MARNKTPWHLPDPNEQKPERVITHWYVCFLVAFHIPLSRNSYSTITDTITLECPDLLTAKTRAVLMALSRWPGERYSNHFVHVVEVPD